MTNQGQLEDILFSVDEEVSNGFLLSPEIIKLSTKMKKARIPPNRAAQCILNGYICAFGRIALGKNSAKI